MDEGKELKRNVFKTLYDTDATDRMFQKQNLSYLPWATAYSEVMKEFPEMTYEFVKHGEEKLPYLETPLGLMVSTVVTIDGVTREMQLPVMDSNNKAMKSKEYTYSTKSGERTVAPATMFDINKSLMRCLAKNLAMFGLGLHLWTKEELPESMIKADKLKSEINEIAKKKCSLSEKAKSEVVRICTEAEPDSNGNYNLIEDVEVLEKLKKSLTAIRK